MLVLIVMFRSGYITVGYKVQKTILTSEQLRNWVFIITLVKGESLKKGAFFIHFFIRINKLNRLFSLSKFTTEYHIIERKNSLLCSMFTSDVSSFLRASSISHELSSFIRSSLIFL